MGQPDVGPAELENRGSWWLLPEERDSADCQSQSQGRLLIGLRKKLYPEASVLLLTLVMQFASYCAAKLRASNILEVATCLHACVAHLLTDVFVCLRRVEKAYQRISGPACVTVDASPSADLVLQQVLLLIRGKCHL